MSPKIFSPIKQVECPICKSMIDLSSVRNQLYQHIKDSHKDEPLVSIAESKYKELNLSIPMNLKTLSFDDLARALSDVCKYSTRKKG